MPPALAIAEENSAPATLANASTTPVQHFQPWNFNDPSTWDRTPNYDEKAGPANNLRTGGGEDAALYGLVNVGLFDERLTSSTASMALAEAGVRGRRQKEMLDQVAAQHILQAYFASRASTCDQPR